MGRYRPQSQNREIMAEKREIAIRLLRQGLSTTQIAGQLHCSPFFVRQVRNSLAIDADLAS